MHQILKVLKSLKNIFTRFIFFPLSHTHIFVSHNFKYRPLLRLKFFEYRRAEFLVILFHFIFVCALELMHADEIFWPRYLRTEKRKKKEQTNFIIIPGRLLFLQSFILNAIIIDASLL